MKRGLVKFLTAFGALIGVFFAVLWFLQYYGVYDFLAAAQARPYLVYVALAVAVCFAAAEIALLAARPPKTVLPDSPSAEASLSRAVRPTVPEAAPLLPARPETAFADPPQPTAPQQEVSPATAPQAAVSSPAATQTKTAAETGEFAADWEELNRLIGASGELGDIRYTGTRASDLVDLDEEFLVDSLDEAVAPVRRPAPAETPPRQEGRADDVDYILGKIDEIIGLVTEKEGRK